MWPPCGARLQARRWGGQVHAKSGQLPWTVGGDTIVVSTASRAPCHKGKPLAKTSTRRSSDRQTGTLKARMRVLVTRAPRLLFIQAAVIQPIDLFPQQLSVWGRLMGFASGTRGLCLKGEGFASRHQRTLQKAHTDLPARTSLRSGMGPSTHDKLAEGMADKLEAKACMAAEVKNPHHRRLTFAFQRGLLFF